MNKLSVDMQDIVKAYVALVGMAVACGDDDRVEALLEEASDELTHRAYLVLEAELA